MADTKLHDLAELTVGPNLLDELEVLDRSDTSMDADGTNKRILASTMGTYFGNRRLNPTGITYATHDRMTATLSNGGALSSGTLKMVALWLPEGSTVTSISFQIGTTALALGTSPHAWFALFDSSLNLLRQSTDDTAAVMGASTLKTYNLSSTFLTTYSGLHYIGAMVSQTGGTLPSFYITSDGAATGPLSLAPIISGTSTTGLTTTAPNPAAALTAISGKIYGGVA